MPEETSLDPNVYISYSRLDTLAQCPHKYFRRYVLKEPDIIGAPLIMGRAFHQAMEANFRYRLKHKVDLPKNEIAKIYRDSFDEEAALPAFVDIENLTEDQVDWGGEDPQDLREIGQRALLRYHKKHAPFLEPLFVEYKLQKEVLPGVVLTGYIDLVTEAGTVIDYKLVNYVWPAHRVHMALQPTCYSYLLDAPINFDYHFVTKGNRGVGISIRRTQRTSADTDWLAHVHIPQAVKLIEQELWIRNPSQQCHYCAYRLGCGYRV